MKLLFLIDGLRSGGKERRLLEVINGIKNMELNYRVILRHQNIAYDIEQNILKNIVMLDNYKSGHISRIIALVVYCKEFRPDIIHTWSTLESFYAVFLKMLFKCKLIVGHITSAPYDVIKAFGITPMVLSKISFHYADIILANSRAGLKSFKVPSRKSRIIYNGFDYKRVSNLLSVHDVRSNLSINTRYIVGMVASFTPLKDWDLYLRVAKNMVTKRNDLTFLCIGDGPLLESYRSRSGYEDYSNIVFTGWKAGVESYMRICDVGILLSKYGEGLSNAILEYQALGVPVIATRVGGNKEIIVDGKTGYLVLEEDVPTIEKKISFLLKNDDYRIQMGHQAKANILAKFNYEKMISNQVFLYQSVMKM